MKTSRNQHPHHATAELKSLACPLHCNYLPSSLVYNYKAPTPKITNDYPHYIGLT